MREIKFRGRRLGQWYYGDLEYSRETDYTVIVTPEHDGTKDNRYRVERATVGQYTGLKDMNGKEIYEGDILMVSFPNDVFVGRVDWVGQNGRWNIVEGTEESMMLDYWCTRIAEIIGNIHDNPELLK